VSVKRELITQIVEGEAEAAVLADPATGAPNLWETRLSGWHEKNRRVLALANTTSLTVESYDALTLINRMGESIFGPTPSEQREWLQQRHDQRLQFLREVLERLIREEVDTQNTEGVRPDEVLRPDSAGEEPPVADGPVFVVHGRDNHAKIDVARTLQRLTGNDPVILHEQPDGGDTVIEKFERHAGAAAAAVVILSPDDVGGLADENWRQQRPRPLNNVLRLRARQNVVYELGWFHGRLGRGRVIALLVDDVEQPSDISGVLYLELDPAGAWRYRLGQELAHIGLDIDLNRLR
jgi:predicted nucleotide-binding protein